MQNSKFIMIIILNIIIVVTEIYYGLIANSITLIIDALHNFSDIIAIIISFLAIIYARKSATITNTIGFVRAEMMATFINSLMLILMMLYILYESIQALISVQEIVDGELMMMVATVALIANSISAYILLKMRRDKDDINIHSAYLHFLADSLLSFSVIVGGFIIYFFGINLVDKILGLLFAIYIIYATSPLLKRSFYSLMDIEHIIDIEEIEKMILKIDGVRSLHDIHIIEPSPKHSFFYGHIVLEKDMDILEIDNLIIQIEIVLKNFKINHSVIQPESSKNSDEPLIKQNYEI